ncbi:hypothetical protein [uncultured Paraglaciecola sp.]|uniref:hypothetical protein n=1 Tax=uncultured Paraglaciecola sp. TaxID=1765024 RepID=UPI002601705E|nr:hypothetical protein [uncultured Paraglaciecola sp.]
MTLTTKAIAQRQAIFNTVYRGLRAQNWIQSVKNDKADHPQCKYVSGNNRCAAGHLINPRHYHVSLEGNTVNVEVVRDALRKSGIDDDYWDFVKRLQIIHDEKSTPPAMWEGFMRIAEEYNFEIPKPERQEPEFSLNPLKWITATSAMMHLSCLVNGLIGNEYSQPYCAYLFHTLWTSSSVERVAEAGRKIDFINKITGDPDHCWNSYNNWRNNQ